LADALQDRLTVLNFYSKKWYPEALRLLLELSDQPTFNSKLSDVGIDEGQHGEDAPELRWEDIAKEDGWDEDINIWNSIDYNDGSVDEEYDDNFGASSDTSSPFAEDMTQAKTARELIIQLHDDAALQSIIKQQEWRLHGPSEDSRSRPRKVPVPEGQILREVLTMLQGLDTTLFDRDGTPNPTFQTSNIAWQTHKSVIGSYAESGGYVSILRRFVASRKNEPQLQALQDCISERLRILDDHITHIQKRLVQPDDQVVVSLVAAKDEMQPLLQPLLRLSRVILRVEQATTINEFWHLELLFDESSAAQLSGDDTSYEFLAKIFVECFNNYLRPVRYWMEEGRLLPSDDTFFICEQSTSSSPSNIWIGRFKLRKTQDGRVHAPKFLQPAVTKIYSTGKSIVVLRHLGLWRSDNDAAASSQQKPLLTYEAICPTDLALASFPDLFNMAFEQWIEGNYSATSTDLKAALFTHCDFAYMLRSVHNVYLMADGVAANVFCEQLFEKLDGRDTKWHDGYALTVAAQNAFGSLADPSRLFVSVSPHGRQMPVAEARGSIYPALTQIHIHYRLVWSVQMILSEESMARYQTLFTILLQIKRATYVIHKARLVDQSPREGQREIEKGIYYAARNRIIWFCDTFQEYLFRVVLATITEVMQRDIAASEDIDGMISAHDKHTKHMVDQACLAGKLSPIHDAIRDILDLAIQLEDVMEEHGTTDDGSWSYMNAMQKIETDFEQLINFIYDALRSMSRTLGNEDSARWDILADMLQPGSHDEQ
jgi:gamma-tubulin complex component 5